MILIGILNLLFTTFWNIHIGFQNFSTELKSRFLQNTKCEEMKSCLQLQN